MVIRAGKQIQLTSQGETQFPRYAGIFGTLVGYNSPTEARVSFDGLKTQIALHRSYLKEVAADPRPKMCTAPTLRDQQAKIVASRKLIRSAFDVIRRDPKEQSTVRMLAAALGGRIKITQSILDTARTIISDGALGGER